jgi:DNA-binding CsgD family transcriptional regulator
VLLSDPSRMLTSLTQSLHSYYRLTPAEAKLVQALIQGLSPQEYAQHMDLSIHTVRSQFKTAAAKVGVSRQADLVRVVLMGPAMLRWQEAFG